MKITFVTTIYNEEKTIELLLNSLVKQSRIPDEIIIVDGGSSDHTVGKVNKFIQERKDTLKIKLLEKKGNRSVGRNEGIKSAKGEIIVLSDAGCVLERNFIEEIIKPFTDKSVDVIAGYYIGEAKNIFQKCLIPYVLVMPENVNPDTFLPATRSMAIKKSVWEEMGGFDERYSHNEDYVFAKKLEKNRKKIKFTENAVVRWAPRTTIKEAFNMFYRFALGDMEAGIIRPKVVALFLRYIVGLSYIVYLNFRPSPLILSVLLILLFLYTLWAVLKNYRYVRDWRAILYLPVIQYTADLAVIAGSIRGIFKRYGV